MRFGLLALFLCMGTASAQFFGQSDPVAACSSSADVAVEHFGSGKTKIAFINGIFADMRQSRLSTKEFYNAFKSSIAPTTKMPEVGFYWNPGKSGVSVDLMQVLLNKIQEDNVVPSWSVEQIAVHLLKSYRSKGNYEPMDISNKEEWKKLLKYLDKEPLFSQFIKTGKGIQMLDSVLTTTEQIKVQALSDLTAGKKVVLLTYSQGTLYGKEVYKQIAEEYPEFKNSLIQVGVGAVTNSMGNNGPYVTFAEDYIVNIARSTLDKSILPPNYYISTVNQSNEMLKTDKLGHSFEKIYLNPKWGMREMVLQAVKDAANNIEAPKGYNGPITATLVWDTFGDVDLHVIEPMGQQVFYRNPQGDVDYLDRDDRIGTGPEHYYTNCQKVKMGRYSVGVNYYYGEGPRMAMVVVSAFGQPTQSKQVLLPASNGPSSPQILFDIELSRERGNLTSKIIRR